MRRPRSAIAALALAACGGGAAPDPELAVVGHADLGARGMNAALALAGDTAYVGSRIDGAPIAIVDVSDPAAPALVGELGAPDQGLVGMSSRELRAVADLDLLVVLDLVCNPELHGCTEPPAENNTLRLYDIADRRAPALVGSYVFSSSVLRPNAPHEFFLWRDPTDPGRVLIHLSTPGSPPSYQVIDVTDAATPTRIVAWDAVVNGGLELEPNQDSYLHSVSVSGDGRTAYFSHELGGVFVVDVSAIAGGDVDPMPVVVTPVDGVADWAPPQPAGPHSAVEVPGRGLLVVTDEVYPPPFNAGCPYGWLHVVDLAEPTALAVVGEYKVEENAQAFCADAPVTGSYTAHNATVTPHLALVSWHAAGLQAIDLTDPAAPARLAELRPEPLPWVTNEDPVLGDALITWSYPIVRDGLIYVVDIRNGLYIVRYTGPYADELDVAGPLEGNSNLGY